MTLDRQTQNDDENYLYKSWFDQMLLTNFMALRIALIMRLISQLVVLDKFLSI
jgi:hypothetical protein